MWGPVPGPPGDERPGPSHERRTGGRLGGRRQLKLAAGHDTAAGRETGLRREQVYFSATHTHSGASGGSNATKMLPKKTMTFGFDICSTSARRKSRIPPPFMGSGAGTSAATGPGLERNSVTPSQIK